MEIQLFQDEKVFCPICGSYFRESHYLKTAIESPRTLWLANMVTHYRHNHITSWNKCWSPRGGRYRSGWFGSYEQEKHEVNERAKRQILRKAENFLKYHKFKSKDFDGLSTNSDETIDLARHILDGIPLPKKKQKQPVPANNEKWKDNELPRTHPTKYRFKIKGITRETELAYLVQFEDKELWVPKSSCDIGQDPFDDYYAVDVPEWYVKKNNLTLELN